MCLLCKPTTIPNTDARRPTKNTQTYILYNTSTLKEWSINKYRSNNVSCFITRKTKNQLAYIVVNDALECHRGIRQFSPQTKCPIHKCTHTFTPVYDYKRVKLWKLRLYIKNIVVPWMHVNPLNWNSITISRESRASVERFLSF